MTSRRRIALIAWATLTVAAIVWLALGNLTSNKYGSSVLILVAFSLGFGAAKAIAWRRLDREDPLWPHLVPLRITSVIGGILMFGPIPTYAAGWIGIWPTALGFLGGLITLLIGTALFSDGYQALWIDSLIFRGRLNPPEDDYLLKRDSNRRNSR